MTPEPPQVNRPLRNLQYYFHKTFLQVTRHYNTIPTGSTEKMKRTYQAVSDCSIDSKFTKLQKLHMVTSETVIEFSNKTDVTVN